MPRSHLRPVLGQRAGGLRAEPGHAERRSAAPESGGIASAAPSRVLATRHGAGAGSPEGAKATGPLARTDGLVERKLAGELVVYDAERHEAHCLNPAAAVVFKYSDGRTGVGDIAERLHAELNLPPDEGLVWLALERLEEARLLERTRRAGGGCPRSARGASATR